MTWRTVKEKNKRKQRIKPKNKLIWLTTREVMTGFRLKTLKIIIDRIKTIETKKIIETKKNRGKKK